MLVETGRIVAVEKDYLWVETIRKSTCQACSAQKGCGYGLMNTVSSSPGHRIRALIGEQSERGFQVDDTVEVQIAEEALVSGALWVYIVPLLSMLLMAAAAASFSSSDGLAALFALFGLIVGFIVVRRRFISNKSDSHYQPVVKPLKAEAPSCLAVSVEG